MYLSADVFSAGNRENEGGVLSRGGFEERVGWRGDHGAEGGRGGGVPQAPDCGEFFLREGAGFGQVEDGGEGFYGGG